MLDITVLLENLEELASKDLQEKLWLHGNKNRMSTFTEAICGIFDDARLTRALETGYIENNFSSELFLTAKKLDQLIDLIPENLPPEKIIKHPKMCIVRVLSFRLLVLFKKEYKLKMQFQQVSLKP